MQLTQVQSGAGLVVRVDAPRIDAAVAIRFRDGLMDMASGAPGRVILDLSAVGFIDSSGLGAIVGAMKQLGRRLELAGLGPAVEKVFRLTRMDSVFRIHPSAEAALDAAGQPS